MLRQDRIFNASPTYPLVQVNRNSATSNYNALQLQYQRHLSRGLQALGSYTWSHSIDDTSINGPRAATRYLPTAAVLASGLPQLLLRGDSDFDIRQNLALSMVYEIPSPKNAFAKAILGHWSFDPIYHFQTAAPMDMPPSGNASIAISSGTCFRSTMRAAVRRPSRN